MTEVVLGQVGPDDVGELLTLQRAAFVGEAALYDAFDHPALLQTVEELRRELRTVTAHAARRGTRMVGAVRVRQDGRTLHVARLSVAPDLQGTGIGSRLLRHVEATAGADVDRLALFTGALSAGNLRLYARHGYVEERREVLPSGLELVHLVTRR